MNWSEVKQEETNQDQRRPRVIVTKKSKEIHPNLVSLTKKNWGKIKILAAKPSYTKVKIYRKHNSQNQSN